MFQVRTHDQRQHRLALNTNALTLWDKSPFLKTMILLEGPSFLSMDILFWVVQVGDLV
jgi:hypothetical protein